MPRKKAEETEATVETPAEGGEETSVVETVVDTVASAVDTVADTIQSGAAAVAGAIGGDGEPSKAKKGKRAERIGVVSSDKMTKTVVVNVDRLVKHPTYRKYVRRSKKFMAHDEMGAKIGDKVRIIETRPMSARKRWRVVEIVQRAEV
jgi:small subunit ribosomal protein S17